MAVTAQITVTHIVDIDQDDVGTRIVPPGKIGGTTRHAGLRRTEQQTG